MAKKRKKRAARKLKVSRKIKHKGRRASNKSKASKVRKLIQFAKKRKR